MYTITENEITGSDRDIKGVGFTSLRYLLEKDNMGFSLHKTIIPQGGPYFWHYKNHLEACFCVSGIGELTDMRTGKVYPIKPSTTYVLNDNDPHTFKAITDVVLISVFNPPVKGNEVHREDGSY